MDSDFWTREPKRNSDLNYASIGSILESAQYGISIEMNEDGNGVPIYRMNEIHNMLCDFDVSKSADIKLEDVKKFKLNDRDVLFNRTNSYEWVGRTGLFREQADNNFVFASYLVRLVPNEKVILPEYLVAFLNCKYGIWDIRRRSRQSINQTNVNPEEVKEIEIPLLGYSLQQLVKQCFDSGAEGIQNSKKLMVMAESTLNKALGLDNWSPATPLSYVRSSNDAFTSGRLDSQYFAPRVSELIKRLGRDGLCIGDVAPARHERFKPNDSGMFDYIEIGGLGSDGTATAETLEQKEAPSRATQFVRAGDVITSTVRPIRRLSALIAKGQDGNVCSSGFAVLNPQKISSEVLLTYLRLPLFCELMDLHTSATMYPAISETDLLSLPIPAIDAKTQLAIQQAVREAAASKQRASNLLEATKRAVEIAIEDSETTALAYLKGVI